MFYRLLHPRGNDANYSNGFRVIVVMEGGYELDVSRIGERIGTEARDFWAWSAPNRSGEVDTRDETITAFRAAFASVTPETLAKVLPAAGMECQRIRAVG
ncbi:MAG: hypothetical protein JWR89_5209 [Tardiphaga sp.]|uniref:hypothetical protein n=1 Tax=Tardiphaga sp. TaxID=1926292 RepID=UPI00261BE8B3|nr:hypothetical protein [Tardiphaga sp.]MDB5505307.1 hypothetical protein [Tardiphaga sp.]